MENMSDEVRKAPLLPSNRLLLGLLACSAITIVTFLRVNLSLSVVCMVKPRTIVRNSVNSTDFRTEYFPQNNSVMFDVKTAVLPNKQKNEGEFDWSRELQGYILSSYFYGCIVTQIIGGWLAGRFGGKHVLGSGILIASIATLASPVIARSSPYCFIFIRAVVGAGAGVVSTSIQSLWGVWAPPLERSILSSLSFFGLTIGAIGALLISSMFCTIPLDNGWPFAFYVTGIAGCVFWIIWNFLAFNTPEKHPRITVRELEYIKHCTGRKSGEKRPSVPWVRVLTSLPVIAIIVTQTTFTWFAYTGSTTMPLYLRDVLKFDIKKIALFMILPYIGPLIAMWPMSYFADYLRRRKILSTGAVRKLYQCTSSLGCAVLLVMLSSVDYERRYLAVAILIINALFQALANCGFLVNPQDIAPRYAGVVFGIANTFGTLSGILAPMAVGNLTQNGTQEEWKKVFYIAAGIAAFGGLFFGIFGKGEVQPWANTPADEADIKAVLAVNEQDHESKNNIMS